jgi:hypothetical protein
MPFRGLSDGSNTTCCVLANFSYTEVRAADMMSLMEEDVSQDAAANVRGWVRTCHGTVVRAG